MTIADLMTPPGIIQVPILSDLLCVGTDWSASQGDSVPIRRRLPIG
jgi:hypothetical protein